MKNKFQQIYGKRISIESRKHWSKYLRTIQYFLDPNNLFLPQENVFDSNHVSSVK